MSPVRAALALATVLSLSGCQADGGDGPSEIRFDVDGQTVREQSPEGTVQTNPRQWVLGNDGPIAVTIRVVSREATGSLTFGGEVSATLTMPDGTYTAEPGGRLWFEGSPTCTSEPSILDPSATVTFCRYRGTFAFTAVDGTGRQREVTDGRFTASVRGLSN